MQENTGLNNLEEIKEVDPNSANYIKADTIENKKTEKVLSDEDLLLLEEENNKKKARQNIFTKEVEYEVTDKNGRTHKIKYTRKKYISPEIIEDMKRMLNAGIKRKIICEKYNITLPTLKKYTY